MQNLKIKEALDVCERFSESGPVRENELFETTVRCFKPKEDIIRILSPNEKMGLSEIQVHLAKAGKLLSNISEETFSKQVPLVGGKPNGNFIVKMDQDNNLKEGINFMEISGIQIRIVKKSNSRKCYKCNRVGHLANKCLNKGATHRTKDGIEPPKEDSKNLIDTSLRNTGLDVFLRCI